MEEYCLVIMPFDEKIADTYTHGIKPAVESKGMKCIRLDENDSGNIVKDIVKYIQSAKMIIADLTDLNANVFYELGIAHTLGNNTVMIVQNINEVPFDIKSYRVIEYSNTIRGGNDLQTSIRRAIETLGDWSIKSNNPVQDFLPENYTPLNMVQERLSELSKLKETLASQEKVLKEYEIMKLELAELKEKAKELELLNKYLQNPSVRNKDEREVNNHMKNENHPLPKGDSPNKDDGKKSKIKFTKIS